MKLALFKRLRVNTTEYKGEYWYYINDPAPHMFFLGVIRPPKTFNRLLNAAWSVSLHGKHYYFDTITQAKTFFSTQIYIEYKDNLSKGYKDKYLYGSR